MVHYKKNMENVPLARTIQSLPALVIVHDLTKSTDEDDVIEERRIDLSNPEDRKSLGKLTAWALTNHCSVETMAIADISPPSKEVK